MNGHTIDLGRIEGEVLASEGSKKRFLDTPSFVGMHYTDDRLKDRGLSRKSPAYG
jgi:hypothetical protein